MGYPPRLCFDGAIYHITIRGDNREPVFVDEADHQQYLMFLRRYKDRFRFLLHAYALMPNHVHLILEPQESATVSKVMQCVTSAYARYFNHRHGRVGHVFQERFHSRLVAQDVYLLVASRYVHLNPVRARLVSKPTAYSWSSYRSYLDPPTNHLELVDTRTVLSLVDRDPRHQRAAYRCFVEERVIQPNEERRETLVLSQAIIGSPTFASQIHTQFQLVRRPRGRPPKRP